MIGRREFIMLIGGAATWPIAARAQQTAMPVIGFLDFGSAAERSQQIAAFRKGLAEEGFQEGQNVALEIRWAEGQYARFAELAADLVRRGVRVIAIPGSGTGALAAKAATTTIPIVFGATGDPVKAGLVASLNRPGGNATGVNFFTAELVAKRMQLLREVCRQLIALRCWSIRPMRRTISRHYTKQRRPPAGSGSSFATLPPAATSTRRLRV
jgi:putative ABC transport system substrate-binding protein